MEDKVTADQVQDKALSVADKALDGLSGIMSMSGEIFDKLSQLTEQHGQEVVDLGLNVVRINALGGVLINVVSIIAYITSVVVSVRAIKKGNALNNAKKYASDDGVPYQMFGVIVLGVTLTLGTVIIIASANIWNYVGVFYPELYLANEIMQSARN